MLVVREEEIEESEEIKAAMVEFYGKLYSGSEEFFMTKKKSSEPE